MIGSKERYSYIILVLVSLVVAITAVTLAIKQVDTTTSRFCDLVAISNEHPVRGTTLPPPPVSLLTQRAEAMYTEYKIFGTELGCKE